MRNFNEVYKHAPYNYKHWKAFNWLSRNNRTKFKIKNKEAFLNNTEERLNQYYKRHNTLNWQSLTAAAIGIIAFLMILYFGCHVF